MANQLYTKAVDAFARAQINWEADDIRIILIDLADYIVDIAAHEFLSSVPLAARVSTVALAGKTVSGGGVCDASDPTFPAVTGDESEALIIYKHTGVDSTARLIEYIDTAPGLPILPNTGDITVRFSASGIFKL